MRTFVYVDGFNLYYGALKGTPWKWLDLPALFAKVLQPHPLARRIAETTLVRDADAASQSCARRVGDVVDADRIARTDLATNRRLLDEAIARDAHRGVADRHR